jgi:hypothetical protein
VPERWPGGPRDRPRRQARRRASLFRWPLRPPLCPSESKMPRGKREEQGSPGASVTIPVRLVRAVCSQNRSSPVLPARAQQPPNARSELRDRAGSTSASIARLFAPPRLPPTSSAASRRSPTADLYARGGRDAGRHSRVMRRHALTGSVKTGGSGRWPGEMRRR